MTCLNIKKSEHFIVKSSWFTWANLFGTISWRWI